MIKHHERFMRDDNHFVRFDDKGWILVGGSWYDVLENSFGRFGDRYIRFPVTKPIDIKWFNPDYASEPILVDYEYMEWERMRFTPGYLNVRRYCRNLMVLFRWEDWLSQRICVGWRLLPDGRIPCDLNKEDRWRLEVSKNVATEFCGF